MVFKYIYKILQLLPASNSRTFSSFLKQILLGMSINPSPGPTTTTSCLYEFTYPGPVL